MVFLRYWMEQSNTTEVELREFYQTHFGSVNNAMRTLEALKYDQETEEQLSPNGQGIPGVCFVYKLMLSQLTILILSKNRLKARRYFMYP